MSSRPPNDRLIALLLSSVVFLIYCLTLCRTIYTGDDGDFIVCMATFGNSHPTGYPLFLLLGHLFLWLLSPVLADPAARINTMTALFGASAIGLFYRFLVQGLRVERFWAAAGALLLAFSPTLWQQSLSCEVYSLTCLYLASLLYVASVWREQPGNTRLLRGMTLLYGFAATNHLTIVLFLPGFLAFVLYHRPSLLREEWKVLLSMVGLFLLPLSLYAYLPLAAKYAHSPLNWGDPSTPQRFWYKITGAQYQPSMFMSLHAAKRGAIRYGRLLWNEFRPWTLWLVPLGLVSLWRRDRALCLLLIYVWFANVLYAINYSIVDIYVYYIPSYLITATLIVAGAAASLRWLWNRIELPLDRRDHYTPLIAAIILALPIVHMSLHYAETDESGNYMESDYSENIYRSAPQGAIVVTADMTVESLWYRRYLLHERPDLALINRDLLYGAGLPYMAWYYDQVSQMYPDIRNTYPGGAFPTTKKIIQGEFLMDVIRRALERGIPVIWIPNDYNEHKKQDLMKNTYAALLNHNFDVVVWGVGQRLYLKGHAPKTESVFEANEALWPTFTFHKLGDWAHQDEQQGNIGFRYFNALMGWAQLCEIEHRYDLAQQAYLQAQQIYRIPDVQAGLDRCAAALAGKPASATTAAPSPH